MAKVGNTELMRKVRNSWSYLWFQVADLEYNYGHDQQFLRINHLTKTWSSPFLYPPQARVPPIITVPDNDDTVLFPSCANVSNVPIDVPVHLMILGSPQVGKSALALRYLTKNQCDIDRSSGKFNVLCFWNNFNPISCPFKAFCYFVRNSK